MKHLLFDLFGCWHFWREREIVITDAIFPDGFEICSECRRRHEVRP